MATTVAIISETSNNSSNGFSNNNNNHNNNKARRRPRILLGVTGSVAAVKAPELAVRLCQECNMHVKILLTRGGRNFWDKAQDYHSTYWDLLQQQLSKSRKQYTTTTITTTTTTTTTTCMDPTTNDDNNDEGMIQLHDADEEWRDWQRLGDPVLHIDLRDWADVFVIAPLSAHCLAKLAHGLCDDTLSCVARAWDFGHGSRPGKPLLLAPAMNTAMWQHPLTQQQLMTIQSFWNHQQQSHESTIAAPRGANEDINIINNNNNNNNNNNSPNTKPSDSSTIQNMEALPCPTKHNRGGVIVIDPQVKTLACGEVGNGALAAVEDILKAIKASLPEELS